MSEDAFAKFKEAQRQGWKHFAPLEALTTPPAAHLVKFANVRAGRNVFELGCGTGVVAITAVRIGARTRGVDLFSKWQDADFTDCSRPLARLSGSSQFAR